MHYELWDAESANVLAILRTEDEGLVMVRRLLTEGCDPDHLALGVDFDEGEEGDDATLPPTLHGAALVERAYAPRLDGSRRTI